MKKLRYSKARIGSPEQPLAQSWKAFTEQQQQAKTGTYEADLAAGSDDALAAEIVGVELPRSNIGAIVAQAIEAVSATGPKRILIGGVESNARTVLLAPVATAITGGDSKVLTLTRETVEGEATPRKTAPWAVAEGEDFGDTGASGVALKAALIAVTDPVKPRRSLASMLSAIEDVLAAQDPPLDFGSPLQVEVDQTDDGVVRIIFGGTLAAPEVKLTQDASPVSIDTTEPVAFE